MAQRGRPPLIRKETADPAIIPKRESAEVVQEITNVKQPATLETKVYTTARRENSISLVSGNDSQMIFNVTGPVDFSEFLDAIENGAKESGFFFRNSHELTITARTGAFTALCRGINPQSLGIRLYWNPFYDKLEKNEFMVVKT